ncbi:MAG: hypothetical protein GJ680_07840 [Alteromonadaceae bacterium]|nr:hypothetical protein [Alteromonadaceae bacterium]
MAESVCLKNELSHHMTSVMFWDVLTRAVVNTYCNHDQMSGYQSVSIAHGLKRLFGEHISFLRFSSTDYERYHAYLDQYSLAITEMGIVAPSYYAARAVKHAKGSLRVNRVGLLPDVWLNEDIVDYLFKILASQYLDKGR